MSDSHSPDRLELFDPGEYVIHVPTGEVYRFQAIDVVNEEATGIPEGTVTVSPIGEDSRIEQNATTVDTDLRAGDLVPVPDRLLDDPEGVLLSFARQEIARYTSRLSNGHDYNGIDGVDILAHLHAASSLAANEKLTN